MNSLVPDLSVMSTSVRDVTFRIETKDGEPFVGGLSRPQAYHVWEKGLLKPGSLLYGIALVQSDRPFLIDYRLHEVIELDELPKEFTVSIDGAKYTGKFLPERPPPPKLGEEITITITKTRFKLEPQQVDSWISKFGIIVRKSDFKYADDLAAIKTDDIECSAKLRKHIPGIIPAYGRKMNVRYPGQPLQCGKCFQNDHLRSKCTNETIPWASYVSVFITEGICDKAMIGNWSSLLTERSNN